MLRLGILSGLIFMLHLHTIAQVLQFNRVEFPMVRDEGSYEIIPAQEHGMFLYRRYAGPEEDQLEITKLDTTLKELWRGFLPIERKFVMLGKRAEKQNLCFLFRYEDFSRFDFVLFVINQRNGNFIRYDIKNFIPFSPVEFQLTDSAALMGGYFNRVPVVTYFSFLKRKSRILPGLLNESGDLTQIKTYPDGKFDVLIAGRNFQGQKTIWLKNYSAGGELLRNMALEPEGNKNLIFARSMKTDNDMQIVAGVFGGRNSELSRGFFMASLDPSGIQQLRYYNFADLENFFKYMRAKREQRIKERIQRRKIKGKKIKFSYRFLVHELVPYNDQYILLGEAFYPRYKTLDGGYPGGFFGPTYSTNSQIRNGRIFDGYYYTHAVVMGFDRDGNIIWDNSFEINDVRTFTLEQFVKLEIQGDKIVLLYLYENQLRSKIIKGNEVLEGKTIESIKVSDNATVVSEDDSTNKLEYWYQSYFFATGIQEIVHPQFGKRKVFYISKISYQQ
jgi:hypothetical protein